MDSFNAKYRPMINNATYIIFFTSLVQYGIFTIISPLLYVLGKYEVFILKPKNYFTIDYFYYYMYLLKLIYLDKSQVLIIYFLYYKNLT